MTTFLPVSTARSAPSEASPPAAKTGRGALTVPPLRDPSGNLLPRYEREKAVGIRRENGARKLKKLNTRHLSMISMRLQGCSLEQVAQSFGCTVATVSRIMNDPLAQQYLQTVYQDRKQEIDALAGKVIEAVRTGLDSVNVRDKLAAVSKYTEVKKTIAADSAPEETAEDVAAKILSGLTVKDNGQVNVQILSGAPSEK